MTSPSGVINLVAKKLKYYFDVKRLEDGFDLSDVHSPILDHPPLKARPTLQYDGLHDRPLKHYFSQPEVRVHLTQLDMVDPQMQNPKEKKVKRTLKQQMRKYHFLKSPVPEFYYICTSSGIKLQPRLVGFGSAPRSQKKKLLKGGWPLLRSAPPSNLPRGEAERLINSATKLLVATTDWDLVDTHDHTQHEYADENIFQHHQKHNKSRPLTAKYSWDTSNRRVPSAKIKAYDDSYVGRMPRQTYPAEHDGSSTPMSSTTSDSSKISSPPPRPPSPPPKAERPMSAKHRHRTIINMPEEQIREEVQPVEPSRSPRKLAVASQTDRLLLDEYDQMEDEVKEGPWGEYRVHIKTGNRIGASTSADVKLIIYGDKGRTPELMLQESKYNKVKFQRDKEDLFILTTHHVGKMKKIKIGHDRSQLSYAWYLESIKIHDVNDKRTYDFPCQRWLSGQDDDHRTYRVLPVDRERAFVDSPEAHDNSQRKSAQSKKSESETSDSESDSIPRRGRKTSKTSLHARQSQRSSKPSSSSTTSTSRSKGVDLAQVSGSGPSESHKRLAKKEPGHPLSTKMPGTVIQLQKKDSEKVEEEIHLSERGEDGKVAITDGDLLAGYKAGLKNMENRERTKKEDQRAHERELLSGPTVHDAARSGNLNRLQELLEKFPEMKDFKDESGWTALHLAAAHGHVDIIKWLTSSAHDDLDVETPTGYTPIHVAAMNGHIGALTVLNAMGSSLTSKTVEKHTPLHLAAKIGHLECVRWLVANRADLKAEDNFGRTPQLLAREYGYDVVADLLRVCERDLADPTSSLSQMHKANQRKGSAALPTITEAEDKTSTSSDRPEVGSTSSKNGHKKAKAEEELQQRRHVYEEQHHRMEQRGISFLDSIRQDVEDEA